MRPVTSVVKEIAMTLTYRTVMVDGLKVFYRTAGDVKKPAVLLLHGFPTSSHMFRELIPALADRYYVVAPDLPGFGYTDAPDRKTFKYSFEHLTDVIDRFTEALKLNRYAIYVFDYGAPVGFRLALRHPERIRSLSWSRAKASLGIRSEPSAKCRMIALDWARLRPSPNSTTGTWPAGLIARNSGVRVRPLSTSTSSQA